VHTCSLTGDKVVVGKKSPNECRIRGTIITPTTYLNIGYYIGGGGRGAPGCKRTTNPEGSRQKKTKKKKNGKGEWNKPGETTNCLVLQTQRKKKRKRCLSQLKNG